MTTAATSLAGVLSTVDRDDKKFTGSDTRVFVAKLLLVIAVATAAAAIIVTQPWYLVVPAQLVLGMFFAHCVELQHQALHGTAFRSARAGRAVGFLLGVPLMVAFSRYRALHLLHHRYLGTDRDTEFFDYAVLGRLTVGTVVRSALDVRRWLRAVGDMSRSWSPRARFDDVITDDATHRRIAAEYRGMSVLLLGLAAASVAAGQPWMLTVWFVPLLVGEIVHFMIELPEHLFCDRTTQDIFRNTRSIRGGWFSFWLTNGNNFHVEHHARMGVPINKLPALHQATRPHIEHYSDTYWQFYRQVFEAVAKK